MFPGLSKEYIEENKVETINKKHNMACLIINVLIIGKGKQTTITSKLYL